MFSAFNWFASDARRFTSVIICDSSRRSMLISDADAMPVSRAAWTLLMSAQRLGARAERMSLKEPDGIDIALDLDERHVSRT